MVSTLSIICMVITLLLSLVLPIVIFVWYGLKQKKKEDEIYHLPKYLQKFGLPVYLEPVVLRLCSLEFGFRL